jgi:hypothetical protein
MLATKSSISLSAVSLEVTGALELGTPDWLKRRVEADGVRTATEIKHRRKVYPSA